MDETKIEPSEAPGLIGSVWRYRYLVVVVTVIFAAAGLAYAATLPHSFTATADVGLQDPPRVQNITIDLPRYTVQSAALAHTRRVLDAAATALREPETTLADHTAASPSSTANEVFISGTGTNSGLAQARADAVATAFQAAMGQDAGAQASAQLKAISNGIANANALITSSSAGVKGAGGVPVVASAASQALDVLLQQQVSVQTELARFGNGVRYLDLAGAPSGSHQSKQDLKFAGLGALLGLLIAMAIAWVLADRRRIVEDPEQVSAMLPASLLGVVPTFGLAERSALSDPTMMPAPAFQFVLNALPATIDHGTLIVTGSAHGCGTTVTALNVAVAAARQGRRVAVLDADNLGRGLSRLIGIPEGHPGMADLAAQRVDADSCPPFELDFGGDSKLDVIAAGAPESGVASFYRSSGMTKAFGVLRGRYDLLIVDCPPLASQPDAASLAPLADGVLVVVACRSRQEAVQELRQRLGTLSTPAVGLVFNRGRRHPTATRARQEAANKS